jgi:hypothetical protein
MDGLNVCHMCGDVLLEADEHDGGALAFGRCDHHSNEVDDMDDGPNWHIRADEWKRRWTAAVEAAKGEK